MQSAKSKEHRVIRKAPWHTEYYCKALEQVASTTGQLCLDGDCAGWLAWFEQNYPELYKKYENALDNSNKLWGSMKPVDMEAFKAAVKIEVDAMAWAIPKYLEASKLTGEQADRPNETAIAKQEALGI
jgi:hypothetical protein